MHHSEALPLSTAKWSEASLEDIALRQLVLEYYDREGLALRRYAAFLGANQQSCDDILQECFLRLQQHLRRGGDQTNLRAWLFRVAHNLSRNSQTASEASKTQSLSGLAGAIELAGDGADAEEALLQKERNLSLRRQIGDLSPAQRECLLLRTQGLKYREIAEVLQISTSAVAENVQRGLERLRKTL